MANSDNSENRKYKRWALPKELGSSFRLAGEIDYCIRMEVGYDTLTANMQDDNGAFDAWAMILHAHFGADITIQLALKESAKNKLTELSQQNNVHYNRFLYRLMKFNAFYGDGAPDAAGWFRIADEQLSAEVRRFHDWLSEEGSTFMNNLPDGEISMDRDGTEDKVEASLSDSSGAVANRKNAILKHKLKTWKNGGMEVETIFRQLPVGLSTDMDKEVFPGKGAMIDLWALSKAQDEIAIFELKANQNKPIGVISELMFYCNYIYDMFVAPQSQFEARRPIQPKTPEDKKALRGYDVLWQASHSGSLKRVCGYILTDALHSSITRNVLAEMSSSRISYYAVEYQWNHAQRVEDIQFLSFKKLF